ncbi:MAG: ChaN family lipoprotein [Candidatus Electrothrix sp.]
MRIFQLSCVVLMTLFLSSPSLLHCAEEAPASDAPEPLELLRQDIHIAFDLASSLMQGKATLVLPPERGLELSLNELEHVRIEITETGQEIAPNSDHTLTLDPATQERTLSLSWQITAPPPGNDTGNLITPQGITLTGSWHPTADESMIFSLNAKLPPDFSGVTEADEIAITTEGEQNILKATAPQPLRAINFAAGPYTVLSRQLNNLTLYSYFFAEDEELAPAYLERAVEYIKRYEALIGPFPYKRYAIVENRLPTGYGMPSFTLLGQTVVRLPFIKDISLGHEVLHSWFGNAINAIDHDAGGNWCEGLTTLLADQTYAEEQGTGTAYRKNQFLRYQAYIEQDNDVAVLDFQHGGDSQPMAQKMRVIGYDKVSMFFHTLRQEIGDEHFFAALRQLYQDKKYSDANWSDLENTFAATSGRDLSQLFNQWLSRTDIPSFTVEQVGMEQKGGSSQISFHIVQQTKKPYSFRLPVAVKTRQKTIRETIIIDSADQEVTVTVPSLPIELVIDPEYDLMRVLDPKERPPIWMQFMGAKQKIAVLPDNEADRSFYLPLTAELEHWGCRIVKAEELNNSELSQGSFLFLGSSSHSRALFGTTKAEETGFRLDVRKNPLNQDQTMVLFSSASLEESLNAFPKLKHYGKYSRLLLHKGNIKKKEIAPADNGIRLPLLKPAVGLPVPQVQEFSTILKDISQSKIIYVGETHTDYGAHLLQLQVIQALWEQLKQEEKSEGLVIGMEMFPRSSQHALDGYINGSISTEHDFLRLSAYYEVWGYDYRMYRDIINYAKAHRIPIIALNLNKEIVSKVFKTGSTDELTPEQRTEAAPDRALDLDGYRERLTQIHALHKEPEKSDSFGGFLQAQAMWDETMAESIAEYLQAHPEKKMVVLAGTGHVYKDSAMPPRVARRVHGRQSVLIANNSQVTGVEKGWQADYLMFTEDVALPPAGKIGVILMEEEKTENRPSRVAILDIIPLGKADEAGLQKGDVILAVDNAQVATIGELKTALLDKKPEEMVQLNIVRKDTMLNIKVELSDMEKAAMMPPGHPKK